MAGDSDWDAVMGCMRVPIVRQSASKVGLFRLSLSKPVLQRLWFQGLKSEYLKPLSMFAFNFNLRRYNKGGGGGGGGGVPVAAAVFASLVCAIVGGAAVGGAWYYVERQRAVGPGHSFP